MIRVNLLPIKEAQRAIGRRQQMSVALLSISVALLVMVIPYVLQGRHIAQLDRDITELSTEIEKYNAQTREVRDLEKKKSELQAKLKVIEDLSTAAPQKLWLVNFSETNGQATITGMALDNQTIASFMRSLQTSPYFFDVDLVETSQSEPARNQGGDTSMIFKKFIVKAQLDYLGGGGKPQAPPAAAPPGGKSGT
jgi:type IV pilus assembly protein PilN